MLNIESGSFVKRNHKCIIKGTDIPVDSNQAICYSSS